MIGLFWNIRGLNKVGRLPAVVGRIRGCNADIVGIIETKKSSFTASYLRSLSCSTPFHWFYLPAKGSAGGILVGCNKDKYNVVVGDMLDFSISVMVTDIKNNFSWKLIVVYGSPYENGKADFLMELDKVMADWQGPTMVVGDFNLVRFVQDKSNSQIDYRWSTAFNSWIDKWDLVELNPGNIHFTWSNRQESPIFSKIDRMFVNTEWEQAFPLVRVKGLDRYPSDHNALLVDSGDNCSYGKKIFRFEKWWIYKESFSKIVEKSVEYSL